MKKATSYILFLFSISIFLAGVAYYIEKNTARQPELSSFAEQFKKKLREAELKAETMLNNSSFLISAATRDVSLDSIQSLEKLPFSLLIYSDKDSLIFWSNNKVQPYKGDYQFEKIEQKKLIEIAGSKYLMIKKPFQPYINQKQYRYTITALIPLYLRYPINNDYLDNHFPLMSTDFSEYVEISLEENNYPISIKNNDTLFFIKVKENTPYRTSIIWAYILYALAIFFMLIAFYNYSSQISKKKGNLVGLFTLSILMLLLRLACFLFSFPSSVRKLPLFNEKFIIENINWITYSLGDFTVDNILFFILAVFFSHHFKNIKLVSKGFYKYLLPIVVVFIVFWGHSLIYNIIMSIVNNSQVYFEFEDFLKIDFYSTLLLFSVQLFFLSFFIISSKLIIYTKPINLSKFEIFSLCFLGAFMMILSGINGTDFTDILTVSISSIVYIAIIYNVKRPEQISYVQIILIIFFFSISSSYMLEKSKLKKAYNNRESFIKTLLTERDLGLENKIVELEKAIISDDFFNVYLNSPYVPYSQAVERLSYLYLDNAFFGRYEYKIHIYNSIGNAKRPEHLPLFELEKILSESDSTISPNLFHHSESNGRFTYWAIIKLKKNNNISGTIAVELYPIEEGEETSVYVELMSNKNTSSFKHDSKEFEYALYKNNQLVYSKNDQFTSVLDDNIPVPTSGNTISFTLKNKKFLVLKDNRNRLGIINIPTFQFLKSLSVFSYIFSSGIFVAIILMGLVFTIRRYFKISLFDIVFRVSLRERIQQGIILVSLLSFVSIAIISIFFFQEEYNQYHQSRLERKIESAAKAAAWQILNSPDSLIIIPEATDLSKIHKIDVNIFNTQGKLLSSSEDAVFGRRLLSRQMNPVAFYKMNSEKLNRFTQEEKINNFDYLSGYVPLKDKNDNIIAILNLPYDFSGNQNLQSKELAQFLGTLLNIYVILLMVASLVAFVLAKSITRPLYVIGEKLRDVQLGGKNEKINWRTRDEDISELISRYNYMIEQLDESTKELSRTQRETAWREMARQIAHEVKNPLTPMKLQIQMLERAVEKDAEKAREMIKKVSKSLIQQIDILANIASEFSNFAKMPAAKNEHFVLNELIENVFNLFSENDNFTMHLNLTDENLHIFADKEQITRVLNNLIKNAIQSIPNYRVGKIIITLEKSAFYARVKVSDNGIGIAPDRIDNIFTPYFTTKSSGTGIGLTMSKNIIESFKGQIYFNTKENIGTEFIFELPLDISE